MRDFKPLKHFISALYDLSLFRILKRVGGQWTVGGSGQAQQVDGDKFVCMDQILAGDQCVIYSFGLANDWAFEDQMDLLGTCNLYLKIVSSI